MTTLGQLLANRENAQKSTGPTTDEGKFRAALNHIIHGFRGVNPVVAGESEFEYAKFKRQLLGELEPHSCEQAELAEQIAALVWKRRRLDRMEGKLFDQAGQCEGEGTAVLGKCRVELDMLLRYKKDLRRELAQAREEFRRLKAEQLAMEKQVETTLDQKLELELEVARMQSEEAARAQHLNPEGAQLHLMRAKQAVQARGEQEARQWLAEKRGLYSRIYSLCGLGDLSREEMADAEGETIAADAEAAAG